MKRFVSLATSAMLAAKSPRLLATFLNQTATLEQVRPDGRPDPVGRGIRPNYELKRGA